MQAGGRIALPPKPKPTSRVSANLPDSDAIATAPLNLDILIHSPPLAQPRGVARLVLRVRRLQFWLKDETLEDSANLPDPEPPQSPLVFARRIC